ncbi:hypothetical protein M758_9G044200 [Ceratodon purpureus]|nr:hypothetical protein M758_9G044200 [Ceratodon purpureus]
MSKDHNDDVQRLLVHFKRGMLRESPSSSSRSHRRRRSSLPDNHLEGGSTSPCTPARTVREVTNTEQSATIVFETPPVRTTPENDRIPVFNQPGVGRRGNEVSPGVFYGSAGGKPAQRPPQLIRLLNEIQNDLASLSTPSGREAIWATFPRQDQAVQFADSHGGQDLAVFQYQDHLSGQRRFLTTTYNEFWRRYNKMRSGWKHHYEIIRQGRPCHLYFDLEFNTLANAEANGEAMVDTLLTITSRTLLDIFSLHYDPSWTVELDSSTAEKFSRHLVIHIPGAAFKDNSHAGAFVGEICKRCNDLRDTDDEVGKLFVLQGESRAAHEAKLFVDVAVYTRNRAFRLPYSSKAGKTSLLLPTSRFGSSKLSEREVFTNSLICKVKEECQQLLTFSTENPCQGGIVAFDTCRADPVGQSGEGLSSNYGKSPFPSLEVFIEAIARIGDVQGKIRSWYHFADHGVVVYNISGNRFCENIGRPHKSNNVFYVVDFRTAGYYQKCHDPDCRGYQSPLRPIPRHTIPPEFPLSTPLAAALEKAMRPEERDSQDALECDDGEDEAWWGEVVSTLADIECTSQRSVFSNQSQDMLCPEDNLSNTCVEIHEETVPPITHVESTWDEDDDWWDAVEREALQLEMTTTIRKLPNWSP